MKEIEIVEFNNGNFKEVFKHVFTLQSCNFKCNEATIRI